jgi:hypothetical protein
MSSIAEKTYDEQSSINTVSSFYNRYQLGSELKSAPMYTNIKVFQHRRS